MEGSGVREKERERRLKVYPIPIGGAMEGKIRPEEPSIWGILPKVVRLKEVCHDSAVMSFVPFWGGIDCLGPGGAAVTGGCASGYICTEYTCNSFDSCLISPSHFFTARGTALSQHITQHTQP